MVIEVQANDVCSQNVLTKRQPSTASLCSMNIFSRLLFALVLLVVVTGCATRAPMATVDSVDLKRFTGDWYVIANIPTFIERDAYNAIESYALDDQGNVPTTFTFNKGGFDGPLKTYRPKGFIKDTDTNALWGMQFIWPIKADYRIVYLSEDYQRTIVGRRARDYVWIMARKPKISDDALKEMVDKVEAIGYDVSKLRIVPQQELHER